MDNQKHFVIIGGGLAGTFMAVRLMQAGQAVSLIDDKKENSASRVGAGLFNIITGRLGAKSWNGEMLLAQLRAFLDQPNFLQIQQHIHDEIIYRPFRDIESYNKWVGRTADPAFAHLIKFEEKPLFPGQIHNPLGGIRILPCGWINIPALIDGLQNWLAAQIDFRLYKEKIAYNQIILPSKKIRLSGAVLSFDHLICCEGAEIKENPWFSYLPIIPNKGEVILVHAPDLNLPFVLSNKIYMIPIGQHNYVVGSTYFNNFANPAPSKKGREEICSQLEKTILVPYRILDHRAGIRPTTPNRRPVIGTHPQFSYLHTCTGFGTKGLLLAPYCSQLLADKILNSKDNIPKEIAVERVKWVSG